MLCRAVIHVRKCGRCGGQRRGWGRGLPSPLFRVVSLSALGLRASSDPGAQPAGTRELTLHQERVSHLSPGRVQKVPVLH